MKLRSNKVLKENSSLDSSVELEYNSDDTDSSIHTVTDELNSSITSDELNDLKYGQYIRWINLKDPDNLKLTNGGIFLEVKLLDTGTHMMVKNNMNRIFQIKMDECICFQKLSDQEKIILLALKYLNN